MRPALRRTWLKLHRWIALSLGWALIIAALLGALLTVAKPLDRWLHPELFASNGPDGAQTRLEPVRQRLQREFGPGASFTFRPPRQPDDTLWVYVRGAWEGVVFFDATGRELGRRGEHEGFYNLLFELHGSLMLGDAGKGFLTIAALAYLFMLASGLVLWWPRRWPPSFAVHWKAGLLRASVDLHNTIGVLLGLAIAVSVATGAYMAWPPLRTFVSSLAGTPPPAVPAIGRAVRAAEATVPLDVLVQQARAVFPDAMVGYVQTAAAGKPVRIRLKLADDPHPNGLSSVWFDPGTAQVLAVRRWNQLDPGSRAVATIYPLHTGELGGTLLIAVVGLTGLALAAAGSTGLCLWWMRRRMRRPQRSGVQMDTLASRRSGQNDAAPNWD